MSANDEGRNELSEIILAGTAMSSFKNVVKEEIAVKNDEADRFNNNLINQALEVMNRNKGTTSTPLVKRSFKQIQTGNSEKEFVNDKPDTNVPEIIHEEIKTERKDALILLFKTILYDLEGKYVITPKRLIGTYISEYSELLCEDLKYIDIHKYNGNYILVTRKHNLIHEKLQTTDDIRRVSEKIIEYCDLPKEHLKILENLHKIGLLL